MKINLLFFLCIALTSPSVAQSLLDDSETPSHLTMIWTNGSFQRGVSNPAPDALNSSALVSRHIRSAEQWDVFLYNSDAPALDAGPYKTGAKKMTLDFFSEHPGTLIQITIQNAQKSSGEYPAGRHSEYRATTTKTNEWETLTFNYLWTPDASTSDQEVDQFAILIAPDDEASAGKVYYFDNFVGPDISEPQLSETLYEDAESVSLFSYIHSDGTITDSLDNPAAQGENISSKVIGYDRSNLAYDAIVMHPKETVLSVEPFSSSKVKMTIQVYSAFPGTEVNLFLQNSTLASGQDFPAGRHSAYRAFTSKTNEWETLVFDFVYRPDPSVPHTEIDEFVLNIAPNTTTAKTFYLDNFYGPELFISSGTVILHINEVMSSNTRSAYDFEGDNSDWIEIHNSGDGSANLKGYFISDDPAMLQKWQLPVVIIHPGEYVTIWASDKNKVFPDGEVHGNFKLSAEGEKIYLTDAASLIDTVTVPALGRDISYGRYPDGSQTWKYFGEATPAESNNTVPYDGYITSAPAFSHPGGFYNTPIDLTIGSGSVAGGEVRYTLDGSEPTVSSPLYSGPLTLSSRENDPNVFANIITSNVHYVNYNPPANPIFKATTVRARVFSAGSVPGPVMTNSYFVDTNMTDRYNVPVWSIVTDSMHLFDHETGIYVPGKVQEDWVANNPGTLIDGGTPANYNQRGDDWERPASIEFFDVGGTGGFKINAGLRVHGGWSRGNAQKSLRLHFKNQYDTVSSVEYPIIPGLKAHGTGKDITEFKRLMLRNSGGDNSFTLFRDALNHSLVKHTSILVQNYRPSIVFLNGEYWGIQNIRERIDEKFISDHYDIPEEDIAILSYGGSVERGIQADADDYASLVNYVSNSNITEPAVYNQIKSSMDIRNFIEYQATEIFLDNRDWPGNNIYFWKNRNGDPTAAAPGKDGKWRWILIDTDFGMGWISDGDPSYNTMEFATEAGNTAWPNPDWSTLMLRRLLLNDNFKTEFINRFADQLNSSFKAERVISQIDGMKAVLEPLIDEHVERWHNPWSVGEWETQIQKMRDFAQGRPDFVRQHIVEFFSLAGTTDITVDVNNQTGGEVKVSSLRLNSELPGVDPGIYPWTGIYFLGVPVTITAIPDPGYRFAGWNGVASENQDTTVTLAGPVNLTAYFEPIDENDPYPLPHDLSKAWYRLNNWSPETEAGIYPPSMIFMQSDTIDPGLSKERHDAYALPYNLSSGTRIEGMNEAGFAFINTGSTGDLLPGAAGRDLGSAILALKTSGVSSATVSFTAGTELMNSRIYGIRLQYRIGTTGEFVDIQDQGSPVEYISQTDGQSIAFTGIQLPAEAMDQPYIQLRWVYYHVAGTSGPRSKLRLDDIRIENPGISAVIPKTSVQISVFPNPSRGNFSLKLTSGYIGEGTITVTDPAGKTVCASAVVKNGSGFIWKSPCSFENPGIYFLRWNTGEEQGFERIMILD